MRRLWSNQFLKIYSLSANFINYTSNRKTMGSLFPESWQRNFFFFKVAGVVWCLNIAIQYAKVNYK